MATAEPTRVLVVEDLDDAAQALATLLTLSGHRARVVADGRSAVKAFCEFSPHVVLLDLGLPGLDGLEVCRRLRALPDSAPVLILVVSGYGQVDDQRRALAAGANAHFLKPADPFELLEAIASHRRE